ncbi:hypothetical protein MMAN_51760 [Mycobacterium mantenii]|uniref:DUF3027 domain-containing protein n=1 Tax=Mycobacterium mantenii TaxID=560555 RepID=A0A1X0FGP2_MYCNT|nr:DUF3027 domain-containing protein [Mycobacterium mantenii]ORB00913.1 hypothetical protein BST30_21965 [Mycobacterium mantenii]BBY41042.1 hypothetical protein MMAN_51760 [Mycobacterium mantenii]
MQKEGSVTRPSEEPSVESAVATVDDWPEGLAAVLTGAADQARAAVVEFSGPEMVGDYLGVGYEDPNTATHRFLAHLPGYQGWQWAVVVAAYPGAEHATISEVVLVPGPTALLAPEWVPWEHRVRPGDLSPGDLLAPATDDPRLVPGYTASGDLQVDETAAEIGLGRRWVMSAEGRADAAERWRTGDYGPDSPMARSTKRVCLDCGFFLPLSGSLGALFGVCGNELSADGHIVDKLYGCGAHSDTPAPAGTGSPAYEPYDDGLLDLTQAPVEPSAPSGEASEAPEAQAESATQEPATQESATQEPATEESAIQELAAQEPAAQEPATQASRPETPAETPEGQQPPQSETTD